MPLLSSLALALLLAGCAAQSKTMELGKLRVVIASQDEVERNCRAWSASTPTRYRILGCWVSHQNTVYSVDDIEVLLHELKHVEEGAWHRHLECRNPQCT